MFFTVFECVITSSAPTIDCLNNAIHGSLDPITVESVQVFSGFGDHGETIAFSSDFVIVYALKLLGCSVVVCPRSNKAV